MTHLQVLVLAVVQGLTEFLPISSTAHLILVPWLFGWRDPGLTYNVVLHAGTLLAVLAYFARTWCILLSDTLRSTTHLLWSRSKTEEQPGELSPANPRASPVEVQLNAAFFPVLIVATMPAALAGYWLESYAETVFRRPVLIAGMLVAVAVLMWLADRRRTLTRTIQTVNLKDAIMIGTAQAVAIIPGTSRAGIAIAAALFHNLTRESAAQFSFLLATPIIAGATLKKGLEVWERGFPPALSGTDFAVGFLVSAIVGYAAIAFLLRYLQVRTLKIFVAYRLVLGAMILLVEVLRLSA